MRYETRWSNGYWKLFDSKFYVSVDTFRTRDHALQAAQDANHDGRWNLGNAAAYDFGL